MQNHALRIISSCIFVSLCVVSVPHAARALGGVSLRTIDFISMKEDTVAKTGLNLFTLPLGQYSVHIGAVASASDLQGGITLIVTGNDSYSVSRPVDLPAGQEETYEFQLPAFTQAGLERVQAAVAAAKPTDPSGLASYSDVKDVFVGVFNKPELAQLPAKRELSLLVKAEGPIDSASYVDVQVNGVSAAILKAGQSIKIPFALQSVVVLVAHPDLKTDVFSGWAGAVLPPNASPCVNTSTVCSIFDIRNGDNPFVASMTVKFDAKPPTYVPFHFAERGYEGGITNVSYKTATTTGQFVCTGNSCPGKPSQLPTGTVVTATMEKLRANPNGNERYVAAAWGDDCAGKLPSESCVITVGNTGSHVHIEATHKIEYRVTIKRADANGRVWVNTADNQAGVSCEDATNCAAGTGSKTYWFLQDKEIRVHAEGEKGYRFSKWINDCTTASPGYCTLKNRAASVTAAFSEFRYNLVAAKDCDPSGHGLVLDGLGLYCGTMNLDTYLNDSLVRQCGATCLNTTVAVKGGVDKWTLHPEQLQDTLNEVPFQCFVLPGQYVCSIRYESDHYLVSVKDAAGNNAYPVITELTIRYSPRADYDVDPFGSNMTIGARATTTPIQIVLPSSKPGPVLSATTTAMVTSDPAEDGTNILTLLVAGVGNAWERARDAMMSVAQSIAGSVRHLAAAIALATSPSSITPYQLLYSPLGAGVGSTMSFAGSVGNIGGMGYAGSYSAALLVQQYVNNAWVDVFRASAQGGAIPAQQFAFPTWTQTWQPTAAGNYRAQYCLLLVTGTDADRTDNCSVYSYFEVNAAYTPPTVPSFKVTVKQEGGGTIRSRVNTTETNFVGCTSTCSQNFKGGAILTLVASPGTGKRFVRWAGADAGACTTTAGAPNECALKVWSDLGVTAVFESIPSEGADSLTLCGDADRSGVVNVTDAAKVLRYASGVVLDLNLKNADVNGDGRITASDSLMIQKASVGSITLTGCKP